MAHSPGLRDRLHDHVALDEIELYAEVLIAVAGTDHPLSPTEIDRVLGLASEPPVSDPPGPPSQGTAADAEIAGAGSAGTDSTGTGSAGAGSADAAAANREEPQREIPREGGSETRFAGPIPPARNGHRPSTVILPVHGAASDSVRTSPPLCSPFLPRFVPWRAWQS